MQAHGKGSDAYKAFDSALDRLEKQVRRYTRRLKNHHDRGAGRPTPSSDLQ
jgi:ribosomal subunit interface protein